MGEEERTLSAYSILLKIHAITGWTIPASKEIMGVFTDQFQKKLSENYRNLNQPEVEYAFRNRGLDIKDWGKELNLTMIDEVILPYLKERYELSLREESISFKPDYTLDGKNELTDQEWADWINDIKVYDFNLLPCSFYDYLVKKELIALTNEEKHGYMERAIAHLLGTLEPGTTEMYEYLAMKRTGKYSASVTATLKTVSKRFVISDYLKRQPTD